MAKLLHFMGTEAACLAALTFLRVNENDYHVNYTNCDVLLDGNKPTIEEYVVVVEDMPGLEITVMKILDQIFFEFCWELTKDGHREQETTDGNFNPRENMAGIVAGRLQHEEPPATLLLRYEIALEKARAIRYARPALYTSLAIAVGMLAQLECGMRDDYETLAAVSILANYRWESSTEEQLTTHKIILEALKHSVQDIINGHSR